MTKKLASLAEQDSRRARRMTKGGGSTASFGAGGLAVQGHQPSMKNVHMSSSSPNLQPTR